MPEAKNPNPNIVSSSSPAVLFAFKPRQVLLAEHQSKMTELNQSKMQKLDSAKRVDLHHAILRYLERNAFPKTLKRFLSEAQIENDDWKASSLDLEGVYCKYMDACSISDANLKTCKERESDDDGTPRKDGKTGSVTTEEVTKKKKKKKKRSEGGDSNAVIGQSKTIDSKLPESAKNRGELLADTAGTDSEAQLKEKKKRKKDLDACVQTVDSKLPESAKNCGEKLADNAGTESDAKLKEKKKRKNDLDARVHTEQVKSDVLNKPADNSVHKLETDESSKNSKDKSKDQKKKDKSKNKSLVEEVDRCGLSNKEELVADDNVSEKKSSKKRKRSVSDENEDQSVKIEPTEESKRRKTEGDKEVKNVNLVTGDGVKANELVNVQGGGTQSTTEINGTLSGILEMNGGEKSDSKKTARKQHNGSAEPKTIHAFQRVKIDEVEFADDKLQDNSYWAKGGAEVGYGAKAQEVLGQVRGRDFRHEKTKKKRGSYRGGQIDLQSHSIKFNYSDEE